MEKQMQLLFKEEIMEEKSFEDNLKELEEIAKNLESGNLNLDEAIKEFEKGMALSKKCTEKLDEAEKKINILVQDENGNLTEESFVAEE